MPQRSVAVFDLGGVLIDWNPRYLYRKLFDGDDAAMEHFLATVCTPSWNAQQDAGRCFAEACATLKLEHPGHAELIDAWIQRQEEMAPGPIAGTVEILGELRGRGVPLYALSNWSAETFPISLRRFEFLRWFKGVVLSGEVRLIKPDPRIFKLFFEAHAIDPGDAVYIDDLPSNVEAAAALGMHGILFTDPSALRSELVKLGLLDPVGQIDHVAAWVSDLERARAFYERWFKATAGPVYSSSKRDFESYFLSLGSGARLELMTSPSESPRPAHLAVSVGSREAVDRLVKAMEAEGVRIVSAPRVTGDGYYEAVIADTEGNLLEITS
jgi:2-haloacid dehalogenase